MNLTPAQNIHLTIAGTDYTAEFHEASIGYDAIDTSGLILMQGSITLMGRPQRIDPRLAGPLEPDALVTITCSDDSAIIPLGRYSYIESITWDGIATTQIKVACGLSRANVASPATIGVCVEPLTEKTVGQAISEMLIFAKATRYSAIGSLPYNPIKLQEIITFDANSSFVRLAGELAYASGCALYVDANNVIQTLQLNAQGSVSKPVLFIDSLNLYAYTALPLNNRPAQKIIAQWDEKKVNPYVDDWEERRITNSAGNLSLVTIPVGYIDWVIEYKRHRVLRNTRQIDDVTHIMKPYSVVFKDIQTDNLAPLPSVPATEVYTHSLEQYEAKVPGSWTLISGCVPKDEGRLLSKTTYEIAPSRPLLTAWYTNAKTSKSQQDADGSTFINRKAEYITYTYTTQNNSLGVPTVVKIESIRRVYGPLGFVFPQWGKLSNSYFNQPYEQIIIEYEYQQWKRNVDEITWTYRQHKNKPLFLSNLDKALSIMSSNSYDVGDKYNIVTALRTVESDIRQSQQPPGIERFPIEQTYVSKKRSVSVVVAGVDSNAVRTRFINLSSYTNAAIATLIAGFVGQTEYGKSYGRAIAVDSSEPAAKGIPSVAPLQRLFVTEPGVATFTYWLDAPTLDIKPKDGTSILSGTGVLYGPYSRARAPFYCDNTTFVMSTSNAVFPGPSLSVTDITTNWRTDDAFVEAPASEQRYEVFCSYAISPTSTFMVAEDALFENYILMPGGCPIVIITIPNTTTSEWSTSNASLTVTGIVGQDVTTNWRTSQGSVAPGIPPTGVTSNWRTTNGNFVVPPSIPNSSATSNWYVSNATVTAVPDDNPFAQDYLISMPFSPSIWDSIPVYNGAIVDSGNILTTTAMGGVEIATEITPYIWELGVKIKPTATVGEYRTIAINYDVGPRGIASGYMHMYIDITTGKIHIYSAVTGNNLVSNTIISANVEYNIRLTWDGSTGRLYIDNVLDMTSTAVNWSQMKPVIRFGSNKYDSGEIYPYLGELKDIYYKKTIS